MKLDSEIVRALRKFPIPPMEGEVKIAWGYRYYRSYFVVRGKSPLMNWGDEQIFEWLRSVNLSDAPIQHEANGVRTIWVHVPLQVIMRLDPQEDCVYILYGEGKRSDIRDN